MGSKLLKASITVLTAAMTGATGGLAGGVALGGVVGFVIAAATGSVIFGTLLYAIIGGAIGSVTGLVIGTGTGVIGRRTDAGSDWAIAAGIGTGLGAGIVGAEWFGIVVIGGIGFTVGWVVTRLIWRVLGGRIYRAPMTARALAGCFTGLALIAVATSSVLESIMSAID